MQIVIIPYRHPKGHSLDTNSFSKVFIPHDHKFNTNLIQYEFSSSFKFHIKVYNHQNHSCVVLICLKIFAFRLHLNFNRILSCNSISFDLFDRFIAWRSKSFFFILSKKAILIYTYPWVLRLLK